MWSRAEKKKKRRYGKLYPGNQSRVSLQSRCFYFLECRQQKGRAEFELPGRDKHLAKFRRSWYTSFTISGQPNHVHSYRLRLLLRLSHGIFGKKIGHYFGCMNQWLGFLFIFAQLARLCSLMVNQKASQQFYSLALNLYQLANGDSKTGFSSVLDLLHELNNNVEVPMKNVTDQVH